MNYTLNAGNILSWLFTLIFLVIGILNLFQVHPVPGLFYMLFSLIFLLSTKVFLRRKLGFTIPLAVKIVLFLLVMWPTLAVGDLAELYGL